MRVLYYYIIFTCSFLDPGPGVHGGILRGGVRQDYGRPYGRRRQVQRRGQKDQTPRVVMVHFRRSEIRTGVKPNVKNN